MIQCSLTQLSTKKRKQLVVHKLAAFAFLYDQNLYKADNSIIARRAFLRALALRKALRRVFFKVLVLRQGLESSHFDFRAVEERPVDPV